MLLRQCTAKLLSSTCEDRAEILTRHRTNYHYEKTKRDSRYRLELRMHLRKYLRDY